MSASKINRSISVDINTNINVNISNRAFAPAFGLGLLLLSLTYMLFGDNACNLSFLPFYLYNNKTAEGKQLNMYK